MSNNEKFTAYEYKNIAVKRDSIALYEDCLQNFGWNLVEEHAPGYGSPLGFNPINIAAEVTSFATQFAPEGTDEVDMVTLKLKRDRQINNKAKIDELERRCQDSLAAINKLEKKNSAQTMGVSLGAGIVGAAFVGLAVYNFIASNIVLGVAFSVIGAIGWAVGFFANLKIGKKKAVQSESLVQQHLDVVYSACEQAHALLA